MLLSVQARLCTLCLVRSAWLDRLERLRVNAVVNQAMPSALPWLVDNASRMTNLSSFMATQPSREHQAAAAESVDEFASVNGDLFGTSFSTLDTKSERSRYYDVESDGTASSAHLDLGPAAQAAEHSC